MKKFLLIILFIFFLVGNLLAINWYSFLGKNVMITTQTNFYTGRVVTIAEMEICRQKDSMGMCVWKDIYYTIFLRANKEIINIACESIIEIEELK